MEILILGSRGFIGSHLASYFTSIGYSVTGVDLNESSSENYNYHKVSILSSDFDTLFNIKDFDACVNASGSGNVSYSMDHPLSDFEANTFGVAKILDTIRKFRPTCKYIHISSAAVYGNPKSLPIVEDVELKPLSPYGFHKQMSESLCQEYVQLFDISCAIIRPFSVYGIGLRKQLLWDICHKLREEDTVSLFGTGKETRDFIHVLDLVSLIKTVIDSGKFSGEVYNAAAGVETSIADIVEVFMQYYRGKKKIVFSGNVRAGDPINWCADTTKAFDIGYRPKIDLHKGLIQYIDWFEKEFNTSVINENYLHY